MPKLKDIVHTIEHLLVLVVFAAILYGLVFFMWEHNKAARAQNGRVIQIIVDDTMYRCVRN